jgi:uncharacterized protein
MKRAIAFALLLISAVFTVSAQQQPDARLPMIEVTGSAEMEIVPDEVYVNVTIREFIEERKKKNIDEIEKEFRNVLEKLKIDNKQVALESVYGYYDYDYKNNRRGEFLNAKTYVIKFSDLNKFNELTMSLDKKGIENIHVQRTGHSKMEEYRRQVKFEALKAAKVKAEQMLQAVNKKVGEVMLIRERDSNMGYPMPYLMKSNMSIEADGAAGQQPIEMQKIKLRYEVEAHFVINS